MQNVCRHILQCFELYAWKVQMQENENEKTAVFCVSLVIDMESAICNLLCRSYCSPLQNCYYAMYTCRYFCHLHWQLWQLVRTVLYL